VEPRVVRISIAPVKSLGLVHPDEVEIGPRGVVGNRRFWLLDEDGRLFNNKRNGPMQRIRPEWDEESRTLALTFPDGARGEGFVELGEPVAAEMYGELHPSRHVIGPWQDAISRFVGRKLTLLGPISTQPTAATAAARSRSSPAPRSRDWARRPA